MPGPVSDSYDPEFGTGANAAKVGAAVAGVALAIDGILGGAERKDILAVVESEDMGPVIAARLTEVQWRVIRFALYRAVETL